MTIPESVKMARRVTKSIFKKAIEPYSRTNCLIGEDGLWFFGRPLLRRMSRRKWRTTCSSVTLRFREYLSQDYVQQHLNEHMTGQNNHQDRL